jgi:hypothetical protein
MPRQPRQPPRTPAAIARYLVVVTLLAGGLWLVLTLPGSDITWERVVIAAVGGFAFAVVTLWLVRRLAERR